MQELLKNRRGDTSRAPWRQTTSTKNYRAERLWPEENARVNYPLKKALCFIKEQEIFDWEDPLVSFAVSWVTLHVSRVGSENFVNSWNYHQIPGECLRKWHTLSCWGIFSLNELILFITMFFCLKWCCYEYVNFIFSFAGPKGCIPIEKMTETNMAVQLDPHLIPTTAEVVQMYEERGGRLNTDPSIGYDPIACYDHLMESREYLFNSQNPSFEHIFCYVVHQKIDTLINAIKSFIQLTDYLAQTELTP